MIYFGSKIIFRFSNHYPLVCYRWCILGLTEQYINGKIEFDMYNKHVLELQSHVLRLNHK